MYCYLKTYLFQSHCLPPKTFCIKIKVLTKSHAMHWASSIAKVSPYQLDSGVSPRKREATGSRRSCCLYKLGLGKSRIWQGTTGWCVLGDAQWWVMCRGGGQGTGRITSWGGRARGSPFGVDIHSHLVTTGVIPPPHSSLSLCSPSLPQSVPHS